MKARTLIVAAAIALMAAPALVVAQGPGGGPGRGGFGHGRGFGPGGPDLGMWVDRLAVHLDLSDEQVAEIEAIVEAQRPTLEALREQLAEGREAWRASHQPGSFDEAAFRAHAAAQSEIHVEMMVAVHKAKAQIFQVLTPEQQQELASMRERMGERRKARRGRFGRH